MRLPEHKAQYREMQIIANSPRTSLVKNAVHFPEIFLLPEEKIRRVKREEEKKEKSKAFYFSCHVPFLKYVERNSTEKICIRTCTIRLAVYSLPGDPTREKK